MRRFLQYESCGGVSPTLRAAASNGSADTIPCVCVDMGGGKSGCGISEDITPTLACTHGGEPCIALDRAAYNQGQNAQYDMGIAEDGKAQTVVAKGPGAVAYDGDKASTIDAHYGVGCGMQSGKERDLLAQEQEGEYIVRRLTPKECGRLQGMPDWWVDFEHKDAPEYKMWGNGVALPCAMYIFEGFAKEGK